MVQQQTIDDKEFRPIDREATVQAVKSFFSEQECDYGYNYQELKRLSGAWGELEIAISKYNRGFRNKWG